MVGLLVGWLVGRWLVGWVKKYSRRRSKSEKQEMLAFLLVGSEILLGSTDSNHKDMDLLCWSRFDSNARFLFL